MVFPSNTLHVLKRTISSVFVLVVLFRVANCDSSAALNAREFNTLCDVITVAEKIQGLDVEDHVNKSVDWAIVSEFQRQVANIISQANASGEGPLHVKTADFEVTLPRCTDVEALGTKLSFLKKKIDRIADSLGKVRSEVVSQLTTAKTKSTAALFGPGEEDKSGDDATRVARLYNTNDAARDRGTACKAGSDATPSAPKAGVSLVNDVLCLCMPAGGPIDKKLCGVDLHGVGSAQWNARSALAGAGAAWTALVKICPEFPPGSIEENGRAALHEFRSRIGSHAHELGTGTKKNWIFGKLPSGGQVNGGSSTHVGLDYGNSVDGKLAEIKWLQSMSEAIRKFDGLKRLNRTLSDAHAKMYAIILEAERALLEAAADDCQKTVGSNASTQSISAKASMSQKTIQQDRLSESANTVGGPWPFVRTPTKLIFISIL